MLRIQRRVLYLVVFAAVLLVAGVIVACKPGNTGGDAGAVAGGDPTAAPQAEQPAGQPADQPVSELAPPNAPTDLSADHVAVFDVVVGWADQSDNEDGFNIYRQRMDVISPLKQVGSVGADETQYHDGDTFCGARYQYIIASYNEAGESPASACWEIQLPPCSAELDVALGSGLENSYDFIAGAPSAQGDFYVSLSNDGRVLFSADQEGMGGLVDLGPADGTPLTRISLPDSLNFVRDGVQAQVGNRYAALARNGRDLILFDLTGLGSSASLHYTIWPDIDLIQQSACEPLGFLTFGFPGEACVSGDGICNPQCSTPGDQALDRPVDEVPGDPGLTLVTDDGIREVPSGGTGAGAAARELCAAEVLAALGGVLPETPAEIAAARAMFLACMERELGGPFLYSEVSEGPVLELAREVGEEPIPGRPTYTRTDLDCDDDPCISGDGICNPTCNPDGTSNIPGTPPLTYAAAPFDRDCRPGDDLPSGGKRSYCGPTNPYDPADGWVLVAAQDTTGDGMADVYMFYNNNPSSPDYKYWGYWDTTCRQPGGDQPNTEVRVEPVWYCTYVGDGTFEWYTVARTYVDGVAVSEEIVSGPFYGPWQPGCPPQPGGGGSCYQICVRWNQTAFPPTCVAYEYRDASGAPCTP